MLKTLVLAVILIAVLTSCAPASPSSSGVMALADFSQAAEPADEVEIALEEVADGTQIRLSYQLNESVRIELVGTNKIVIVDRARWDPYTNETIIWVRSNGDRMQLVEAIRASLSEPIQGTVHMEKDDNGVDLFVVYKDASLIPNP